jgi:hypothetical protein
MINSKYTQPISLNGLTCTGSRHNFLILSIIAGCANSVFGSGVSREPYKSLVVSVANFEACDWSMRFMQVLFLSSHWSVTIAITEARVAPGRCTITMITSLGMSCTVQ